MNRYLTIWWTFTKNATQHNFTSRFGALVLVIGKIIRFFFFFFFLIIIGTKTKAIASYTLQQMILFFLTYQLVDTIPQFLLRSVYRFRGDIVSGDFDYYLVKPFPPLFRALFGWTDVLDIPMILLSVVFLIIAVHQSGTIPFASVFLYIVFTVNAILIAVGIHILILAIGVVTTEIDNATMFYRDLTQMGRVPVDVYKEPLRGIITFVVPVGIMMTVPAKALLGILSWQIAAVSFAFSILFLFLGLRLWDYALKEYASASS